MGLSTIRFYIILKHRAVFPEGSFGLSTIRFYIILKPITGRSPQPLWFEYHTFLHHSQTLGRAGFFMLRLSTIRFYIILKQNLKSKSQKMRLSTIRFYIILKQRKGVRRWKQSLSTIRFYIILKPQSSKMQCLIRTGHGTQTFFS